MPTLHVRNVPEELYERLRRRAMERERSVSAEVLVLLDYALDETAVTQGKVLDRIRRRRTLKTVKAGIPDSTTLLREDRER